MRPSQNRKLFFAPSYIFQHLKLHSRQVDTPGAPEARIVHITRLFEFREKKFILSNTTPTKPVKKKYPTTSSTQVAPRFLPSEIIYGQNVK